MRLLTMPCSLRSAKARGNPTVMPYRGCGEFLPKPVSCYYAASKQLAALRKMVADATMGRPFGRPIVWSVLPLGGSTAGQNLDVDC